MNTIAKAFVRISRFCLLASLCLFSATAAVAQSTYGTIVGKVTDPSGAVVSGAKVETLNQATGDSRIVTTGNAGEFRFINVDPGTYTIKVSAAQFSATEDKNVVVLARETARSDIQLTVKGAIQTVVVDGGQSLLSEDLTNATSRSGDEIGTLALNFRASNAPSPIQAAAVTPGVSQDNGGNLTFSGQLPTATSFSLDGISIQSVRYGGPSTSLFPSVEGIAEFRVNTSGNSAEFAQPTDLTVVTKSGSNQFHGSGFWYFTNKDWNSVDAISQPNFNPTLTANTYGVSAGGPIARKKLFFYFDYEGVRLDQTTQIATQTLPSSWAAGNFSGATGLQLYTPSCITSKGTVVAGCSPISNSNVPVNATSASIAANFFPAPQGPNASSSNIDSSTSVGGNNLNTTWPGTYTADGYDGRMDYNISEKQHVFGRVTSHTIASTGSDATSAGALGAVGDTSYNPLMGIFSTVTDATNVAISHNWIVTGSLVNELRGGYTSYNQTYTYPQAQKGNAIVSALGIKGLPGPPVNGLGGVPVFYVGNLMGGATNQYGHPRDTKNGIWEVGDNLTWTRGKFNSKFGGDWRRLNYQDNITFETGDEYGDYYISGGQVCPAAEVAKYPEACAAAQFVQGYLDEADQAQNGPDGKPFGYHYGFFGQTEFKARRNLSFTFGMRWEINTPFQDSTNQLGNFDYRKGSSTYGKLIYDRNEKLSPAWVDFVDNSQVNFQNQFVLNSAVGLPDSLRQLYKTNIQPRVGVSWSPKTNTVVRASFGMYSVPVLGAVLYSLLGVDTSNFGSFFPTAGNGSQTWANAYGTGNPFAYPWTACPSTCPGYRRANQWDLKDPGVVQWNVSFEQAVGFRSVLKASYVGSYTNNLIYSPDLNQIPANTLGYWNYRAANGANFPNFREVLTRANGPMDEYNALIVEFNRHLGGGLTFDNSFTLTSNQTNALGAVPSGAIPVGGQGDNGDNVLNVYNINAERGNAFYDPSKKFLSTAVYEIPVGRGKRFLGNASKAADAVVGGWSASSIMLYHSGFWLTPYFPTSTSDPSGTGPSYRSVKQQNPDCVNGASGTETQPSISQFFNVNAYSIPASNIGRFGNCGVGILEGPRTVTFSSSFGKTFHITERMGVHYEAQFANLFNFNNWGAPNMNVGSSSFGAITSQQDGTPGSQAGPRSIQMSLRLSY